MPTLLPLTVEDFIEFMETNSGFATIQPTLTLGPHNIVNPSAWIPATGPHPVAAQTEDLKIKLSLGDRGLLRSLSGARPSHKNAWTEKQRSAALMLIYKYRKQLRAKFQLDAEEFVKAPQFRNEPRVLSTDRIISYESGNFILQSPFIKEMIERFRKISHLEDTLALELKWEFNRKIWQFEGTARALAILVEVDKKYGPFETTPEVREMFEAYSYAVAHPTPPTILWENNAFATRNLTNRQAEVASIIITNNVTDELKLWALADAEFVLDNSLRDLLSNYSRVEQNILIQSCPTVNAASMSLDALLAFLDKFKLGPICLSYGWGGEVIQNKIEDLIRIYGTRIVMLDDNNKIQAPTAIRRPRPKSKGLITKEVIAGREPTGIYICQNMYEFGVDKRLPVLIKLTGLLTNNTSRHIESTSFTKVISFQPSL